MKARKIQRNQNQKRQEMEIEEDNGSDVEENFDEYLDNLSVSSLDSNDFDSGAIQSKITEASKNSEKKKKKKSKKEKAAEAKEKQKEQKYDYLEMDPEEIADAEAYDPDASFGEEQPKEGAMDIEEAAEESEKEEERNQEDQGKGVSEIELSEEKLERVLRSLKKSKGTNGLRIGLRIFKETFLAGVDKQQEPTNQKVSYIVSDPLIYEKILKVFLFEIPENLKERMEETKHGQLASNSKVIHLTSCLRMYLSYLVHFLESSYEEDMQSIILERLPSLLWMLRSSQNTQKKLMRLTSEIWASSSTIKLKLRSFLFLKALLQDARHDTLFKERLLKRVFTDFSKESGKIAWRNYQLIIFQINCFVELAAIDTGVAYVVGYRVFQNLAARLKKMMTEKNEKIIHSLYNWHILNGLRLWCQVISSFPSEEGPIHSLVLPFVRITTGLIYLYPAIKFYPLRLHLVRILVRTAKTTKTNIPVGKVLLEMIQNKEFYSVKRLDKNSGPKQNFDFEMKIKCGKETLKRPNFWTDLYKILCDLVIESLDATSPKGAVGLPEMTLPVLRTLKKAYKDLKFGVYKSELKRVMEIINQASEEIKTKRNELEFSALITEKKEASVQKVQKEDRKSKKLKEKKAKKAEAVPATPELSFESCFSREAAKITKRRNTLIQQKIQAESD